MTGSVRHSTVFAYSLRLSRAARLSPSAAIMPRTQPNGNEVPKTPLTFFKPNTSVIGPGEPIIYPRASREVSLRGRTGRPVIGRICKEVPVSRVSEVIFGYTVGNDVTPCDQQKSDGQWARAKGYETCPCCSGRG